MPLDSTKQFLAKLLGPGQQFEHEGQHWRKRVFGSGLRGAELLQEDKAIGRIVEQNPDKASQWAHALTEGHQIWWLFDLTQPQHSQYAGVIVDGVYFQLPDEREAAQAAIEYPYIEQEEAV